MYVADSSTEFDIHAEIPHLAEKPLVHRGTRVHNSGHAQPVRAEINSALIGTVIIGEQYRLSTAAHAVVIGVAAHRVRLHHSGAIVVPEHQGAFNGACGQDDLLGAHRPQALARVRLKGVRTTALDDAKTQTVVGGKHGGVGKQCDALIAGQNSQFAQRPVMPSHPLDQVWIAVQLPAHLHLFVDE